MEIKNSGSDLQALKAAYMKAREAHNTQEMSRLKAEAMELMKEDRTSQEPKVSQKLKVKLESEGKQVAGVNADGDVLEITKTRSEGKV